MKDEKKTNGEALPDELVDDVTGGVFPGWSSESKRCPICGRTYPYNWNGICTYCTEPDTSSDRLGRP